MTVYAGVWWLVYQEQVMYVQRWELGTEQVQPCWTTLPLPAAFFSHFEIFNTRFFVAFSIVWKKQTPLDSRMNVLTLLRAWTVCYRLVHFFLYWILVPQSRYCLLSVPPCSSSYSIIMSIESSNVQFTWFIYNLYLFIVSIRFVGSAKC